MFTEEYGSVGLCFVMTYLAGSSSVIGIGIKD